MIRLAAGMDESKGRLAKSERGCMEVGGVSAARQRGIAGWRGYIQSEWANVTNPTCREQRPWIAQPQDGWAQESKVGNTEFQIRLVSTSDESARGGIKRMDYSVTRREEVKERPMRPT